MSPVLLDKSSPQCRQLRLRKSFCPLRRQTALLLMDFEKTATRDKMEERTAGARQNESVDSPLKID